MSPKELYIIRPYRPEDHNFVLATFLRGLYYGNEFYGMMPKQTFMDNYKNVVEALIPRSHIAVACLKEDPDVILGYSMMSKDYTTMHWIFVKAAWRKKGIGKSLLLSVPSMYSHFTTLGLDLVKKFKDCVFNPFSM